MVDLKRYLEEVAKQPNAPSILLENIWHENAKNVYHARQMIQRHYNGETYQMQIDSHNRFVKDWDIIVINQLHSCDGGEYSVLSAYPFGFAMADNTDGYSEFETSEHDNIPIMRWI